MSNQERKFIEDVFGFPEYTSDRDIPYWIQELAQRASDYGYIGKEDK